MADALLIVAGIAGLGAALTARPGAVEIARYGGAAFLLVYGLVAARRSLRPGAMAASDRGPATLQAVLLTCIGFTFLNPHVYLDTVVLLGTLANQHGDEGRWMFGGGAVLASGGWFVTLGFGARSLGRFFDRPRSWQRLDALIAVVMVTLAGLLVLG